MVVCGMTCRSLCVLAATAAIALTGCRKEETPTDTPKAVSATKAPVAAVAETPPAVTAMLAKADAADGTTDKIVSKCAGCALRMDGSEAHEFSVSGYKMRFCSEVCQDGFEKDPNTSILAMKIAGD